MRLPLPIWLVWHIARLTFIFLRWLAESSYGCISSNGWWKSSAFVLACLICAYLFVSAVRPDVSQNLRDEWRSLFAPRQPGISLVQIQPAHTEAEINPDLDLNPTGTATQKEATSLATPNPSPAPPSPQPGATFLIPTLPPLTTPTLPVPTLVLPTLSPMPAPRQTGPTFAIPTLPPIPPSPQPAPTPPALPTLAFIPTLQPIPSPTPTPTQIPPTATPTPEPTATQIPSPTLTPVPPEPTLTPLQTRATKIDVRQLEALTHELINAQRSMHGIQPLDHIEKVRLIARYHSEDMASRNYFSHDNLEGFDPSDRGRRAGYECRKDYGSYYTFGLAENIHQGWLFGSYRTVNGRNVQFEWFSLEELARNAVDGWMNSPGHRQNILDSPYDRAGMGVAIADDGKVFFTQNFC